MTETTTHADRIRAWRDARPVPQVRPEDECFDLTIDRPPLHVMDVSALLDERDSLVSGYGGLNDALTGAYRERAHLVALLAAQYNSWWAVDPESPDWPVVYVDLPVALPGGSQLSWHISPKDWADLFAHLGLERRDGTWDGHGTEEKYRRVDEFTRQLHEAATR